jgi:hypothetical protein
MLQIFYTYTRQWVWEKPDEFSQITNHLVPDGLPDQLWGSNFLLSWLFWLFEES